MRLQGNDWWSPSQFDIQWGARRFGSLAAWRSATGAETLRGRRVGLSRAPGVIGLGRGGTVFPRALPALDAYQPGDRSPLLGAGLDLAKLFGVSVGPLTFSGWALPSRPGFNIGAE
jgi:hypothetical protein